jgi:hypothetical protein
MTTIEALVQGYYGRSDLLQRIEARLRTVGVDPQKPGFRDLHPFASSMASVSSRPRCTLHGPAFAPACTSSISAAD